MYVTFQVRMVGAWVVVVLGRNASDGKKWSPTKWSF